jgi:NAD(P)-dependent dehydrogenase (short-subunit alcohol dehydrogenase family)
MTDLSGRTVLVTGASKGIGAETAAALGRAGAHVVAHYGSDRGGVEAATAAIPGERKLLLGADFMEEGAPERLWREAVAWRGSIAVLVNNAAVMEQTEFDAPLEEWREGWERALRINVLAAADLTRFAVSHLAGRGGGVIVTLSSWVAQRGPGGPGLVAYSASKAAVKSLTQTVARHYGSRGVLAYVLAPGVVDTELSRKAAAMFGGEEAVLARLALGEMVPPSELADLVCFLAAGRARHLSGATLDVNGASYVR